MHSRGGMILTGENRTARSDKTCHNFTLSTTNPTWTEPSEKPDLRGERQATNRLSHCTEKSTVTKLIAVIFHSAKLKEKKISSYFATFIINY
jgi:hypothetical protein